jgi:oligopeptide/dipeptide ABC transporter ATP-binding protein
VSAPAPPPAYDPGQSGPGRALLTVTELRTYLATGAGVVRAVDGVSLAVREAEVLGIVGESGCGKSMTCRTIVGLTPASAHTSGEVVYHGPSGDQSVLDASPARLRELRGAHLAMIFQDPMTALNPVRTIGDQLLEAVTAHARLSRAQARERAVDLLTRVGIPAPARRLGDYPFQFSGGMLQRALIAIALASAPRLLLADEPTTSLDVIIQDQILGLLLDLQRDTGMSMIMVSHDLAVITEVCDRIVVMYAGQVVEEGVAADIITRPRHPYTRALLDALPQPDDPAQVPGQDTPEAARYSPEPVAYQPLRSIPGSPPSLIDVPGGCRFAPRCPLVTEKCLTWDTELLATGEPEHTARCWRHDEVGRPPQ